MNGSISTDKKDPTKHRLRVYVGRRPSGTPIFRSKEFRGNKAAANAAMRSFIQELEEDQSKPKVEGTLTVAGLIDLWLRQDLHAPHTEKSYRSYLRRRIGPAFGDTPIDKLDPLVVDGWYRTWARKPVAPKSPEVGRNGKPVTALGSLSPSSIKQIKAILSGAYTQAFKWGLVDENLIMARTTPPKATRPKPKVIPVDELCMIMEKAAERGGAAGPLATAIGMGLESGGRRGEMCAIRWSDWDDDKAELTVNSAYSTTDRGRAEENAETEADDDEGVDGESTWMLKGTKTGQEREEIFDEYGISVMRARRAYQEAWAAEVGVSLVPDPFVLSQSPDGSTPMPADEISHGFGEIVEQLWPRPKDDEGKLLVDKRTGKPIAPKWSYKSLRRFATTELLDAGVDLRTIQDRHGWTTATVLLRDYVGPNKTRDRKAAGVIGGVVSGARARSKDVTES